MTLSYREMQAGDLDAAFEVRFSTTENAVTFEELEADYGITPDTLLRAMQGTQRGWVCEDTGAMVGFAMGDAANGEVTVIAVRPSHEGRGIGRELLTRVQDWLYDEGHEELWLYANPDPAVRASGFYRRLGWQTTVRRTEFDVVLVRPREPKPRTQCNGGTGRRRPGAKKSPAPGGAQGER